LSPDRYKLQVTISGGTLEKLRLAKDLLRHAVPSGDEGLILERALTLLVEDLAKTKFAATDRARASRERQGETVERWSGARERLGSGPEHTRPPEQQRDESRDVPASVKRAVFVRDLGRCAFVGKGGHRCEGRSWLEFHHVHPYAEGGRATADNIQLRCKRHNLYEWQLRSTDVRRIEDEWLGRQLAEPRTRSGKGHVMRHRQTVSAVGPPSQ
jgi:hypothetical protein